MITTNSFLKHKTRAYSTRDDFMTIGGFIPADETLAQPLA